MRILFFMHTTSSIGGVETWLDRAVEHLSRQGVDPVVGLVRGMRGNDPTRYRRSHLGLNTLEVDGRGMPRQGRVLALQRAIARVRPSIVLPLGIVDANDAVIQSKIGHADVRLLGRAQGNLEPMLVDLRTYRGWMDRVICPGRLTHKLLVDWAGFPEDRVQNISNGADEPLLARSSRAPGQPIRLGYVGRMSQPDKRTLDLIPLCHELSKRGIAFQLDIAGDGACRSDLEAGLAPWAAHVRLHGALSHEEVYRRVFPQLDLLMMTSSSEAFGIVLAEALMHGVVPISSRYHGFFSEGLVVEGETGLSFEVGNMAAAADAVARLDGDATLLDALSVRAQAHGRRYSWSRSMARWADSLKELASLEPRRDAQVPIHPTRAARGRLERWGLPDTMIDVLRRVRRTLAGPAVDAGGEEWPLFHRYHSPAVLAEVKAAINRLDHC